MHNKPHTEETKKKMSRALKGKRHSLETRKKISRGMIGREFSKEHRMNLSLSIKGRKNYWMVNEKHPLWKGDKVTYDGLHKWIGRKLGKPDTCEHCKRSNLSGKFINWANKSREYKRELIDWLRLCAPCHKKYDNAFSAN